jgi:hypothetical protein
MEKLCTNKNHSYKHNEQINKQNIDNSECSECQNIYHDYTGYVLWLLKLSVRLFSETSSAQI